MNAATKPPGTLTRTESPIRRHPSWPLSTAACLLAALAVASPAAADDLKKGMAQFARKIKQSLDQRGEPAIAVGAFTAPARLAVSSAAGITKILEDELKSCGVQIRRTARLEINGEYRDDEDDDQKVTVLIKGRIVEQPAGVTLHEIQQRISDITAMASLLGASMDLPVDVAPAAREHVIKASLKSPQVHVATTRISAGEKSPYAIELLVKAGEEYRPRAASRDEGLAFLNVRPDEAYQVKLINDSPYDAAVTLTIDGLNLFAFSENKDYSYLIVPARTAGIIKGWHRTNETADSFVVSDYAKSAAAQALPKTPNLGVITACFAAAWPQGSDPPPDEPSGRGVNATARGPSVGTSYREIRRHVGKLRASVSLRYTKEGDPVDLPPK